MKLKNLKTNDHNILDFITFFDSMVDTEPYFTELTFKFGERELLTKVEDLFLDSGLGGVGMGFDLKSNDWNQLEIISEKVVDGMVESTTIKTKERLDTIDKEGANSSDILDDDFIVAYDEEIDTKQSGSSKTNVAENTESLTNEESGTDTTTTTGFDRNRMNYIMRLFKYYPNYRMEIYDDIVDILCVKGYN